MVDVVVLVRMVEDDESPKDLTRGVDMVCALCNRKGDKTFSSGELFWSGLMTGIGRRCSLDGVLSDDGLISGEVGGVFSLFVVGCSIVRGGVDGAIVLVVIFILVMLFDVGELVGICCQ